MSLPLLIAIAVVALASYYWFVQRPRQLQAASSVAASSPEPDSKQKKSKSKPAKVDVTAKLHAASASTSTASTSTESSALLIRHLRGHQQTVRSVAIANVQNVQLVASASDDESLRVWVAEKGVTSAHYARHTLPRGSKGTAVAITSDGKHVVCASDDNRVRQLHTFSIDAQLNDKKETIAVLKHIASFATPHKNAVTRLVILPSSSTVITYASGTETSIHAYSFSGNVICSADTKHISNNDLAVSADGKLLAAATKLSDTKLFACEYSKASKGAQGSAGGALVKIDLAMPLRSQTGAIKSVAFAASTELPRIYVGSADGMMYIHNISNRWTMKEDPKLLVSFKTGLASVDFIDVTQPDKNDQFFIVTAAGNAMQFWRASAINDNAPTLAHTIPAAHKTYITSLQCTREGAPMVITSGDDRIITLWRVPS